MTYKVIRYYKNGDRRVIAKGLTEGEARIHCNDPTTSSKTTTSAWGRMHTDQNGEWFDGYEEE